MDDPNQKLGESSTSNSASTSTSTSATASTSASSSAETTTTLSSKPEPRRPSPLQSSAAFLHHLHTDPKSHHITLSAGLTRQPSAPPTARSPAPALIQSEPTVSPSSDEQAPQYTRTPSNGSGSSLKPPPAIKRASSKRTRPTSAPSRPSDGNNGHTSPAFGHASQPVDIPAAGAEEDEQEGASCVADFMREDMQQMGDAMEVLSVSDTPRGQGRTMLVGRAGSSIPVPMPPQGIEPQGSSPESDEIGWIEFGRNYAAGHFDPNKIPKPPVVTIHEPISSARSSPGLRYQSLDTGFLGPLQPTSSDTNSSGGSRDTAASMISGSTVPSSAPSISPSHSADAVPTVKGLGSKARSFEAERLINRNKGPLVRPSGLAIPTYNMAAATVRMASASSGYNANSFAPLGAPSPDQELTDPMAAFVIPQQAEKTKGDSDPSHGSRFPLSRSMSTAITTNHSHGRELPTINASPMPTPNERPTTQAPHRLSPWANGGNLQSHIPAATAPVEKTIEAETQDDYFGKAVSPPVNVFSRQTSYNTSTTSGSSQQTVTGPSSTPLPRRSQTPPPPQVDSNLNDSPPPLSNWNQMGDLYDKYGWLPAPLPPNEEARRKALYRFNILHTAPDMNFDRIAHMAKLVFNTKIVLIALIDGSRQWHKTHNGLDAVEVDRVGSFCGHSILAKNDEPFVILDTQADWRFAKNPQVTGPPHIRFYAGAPLRTTDGHNLGSLCVIDDKPRAEFAPRQRLILKEFAAVAIREMELWRDKLQLRMRDRIQTSMENFTRECLEMDTRSTDKNASAAAKMDVVYNRAAQLVTSTLDLDGCFILDLSQFEATEVETADGIQIVYRADPYNTETDMLERSEEFSPIAALPVLTTTDPSRATQPLSSVQHEKLSAFLGEHRDGKIYEYKAPAFLKGMFPDDIRWSMVIPVFGVDQRPSTLICAHTSKATKQYLEGYELQFLRAIGVIILSAVLRRRMVLADKAKSILISSVSHELRTPLHGILAAAELLADTELDQNQVSFLRTVQSCGNSLIETVNHVLDFTKLSGGSSGSGSTLKLSKVNLSTLIEQTAEGCWVGQRAKTFLGDADVGSYYAPDSSPTVQRGQRSTARDALPIEIVVDVAHREKGWNVRCEKGGLRRVLMNLIGNSLKFTKEGYIQVTLRELPHPPGSKTIPIEMAVIDTGKGIGKEFLKDQLFHPFSQENPLQTGTGLGLAIVNSIVRSEGVNGKVDVWSAEGMGTEIRVSFDAVVVDEEDDSSSSASINSHQSVAFGSDTSVSIMGFDSSHRGHMLSLDVLSSYACSWHFDITEGVDADITIIHEDEPHARSQVLKNKAVIFLSGSRRSEITELANKTTKAGGYLHVLYKPIGPSALKHALRGAVSWLEDQSSGTSTGLAPGIIETLERPTVTRNSSDASAESNSTVSELSHKFKSMHNERAPLIRRRSEETEAQTEVRRPAMAPRGLTYHHAPPPRLSRKVSVADSEGSGSGSPASTLSTISLADGGVMLKTAALAPGVSRRVKGPRVLVVEDNAINRKVLGAFLGKRGYEWSEAHDGQEGVDVFTATPHGHWDVILMDISMPILNGHGATRAIRQVEAKRRHASPEASFTGLPPTSTSALKSPTRAVPTFGASQSHAKIFALTGLATADDKREAFSSGVDGYLIKPVSLATLDIVFKRLGF